MVSPNSYGSVLVLLLATYVAVGLDDADWARSARARSCRSARCGWPCTSRGARRRRSSRSRARAPRWWRRLVAWRTSCGARGRHGLGVRLLHQRAAVLHRAAVDPARDRAAARGDPRDRARRDRRLPADRHVLRLRLPGGGAIGSAPFFQGGVDGTIAESLFFSFTTLTTTGYGNLVPASNPGQTFAVMEMLIGQLFLITAVAKVINAWRPARWRATEASRPDDPDAAAP